MFWNPKSQEAREFCCLDCYGLGIAAILVTADLIPNKENVPVKILKVDRSIVEVAQINVLSLKYAWFPLAANS